VLPYLDIPFQHASPSVLKSMKRPAATEDNLERIRSWRAICPELTIRSTFIVGFPGETDDDFERLLDFLQEAELDRVGCFQYSNVEGARANKLDAQVPEDIRQERWERFMSVQQEVSARRLAAKVGQVLDVLVDEVSAEGAVGRSSADAPEIDGLVYLDDAAALQPGDLVKVRVTEADDYDLYGKVC
ncbi:MAG: radical SAM protein, partial [Gammaproteobacteria bacterium]|nr:radical SAM protein [Gammaproteobacteria bacterium]